MNKFSDNFSSKDYDDLLNEYAGDALTNEPVKKPVSSQKESKSSFAQKISNNVRRNYNNSVSKNDDISFEDDLANAFKETGTRSASAPKRFIGNKQYGTTESNTTATQRGKRFNVNIDYNPEEYGEQNAVKESGLPNIFAKVKKEKPENEDNMKKASNSSGAGSKNGTRKNTKNKIFVKKNGKIQFNSAAFKKEATKFFKSHSKALTMFGICIAVATVISLCLLSCVNDVLAINREPEQIEVVLPNGATTKDALKILDEADLIKNRTFCYLFAQIMGIDDEDYLPGVYTLSPDMGVEKMLLRFKTTVTKGRLVEIVVPEGFTIDQIFERLEKNKVCTSDSLYKVLESIDFSEEYDFIAKIDNKEERYLVIEGYMYPATYEFEQGSDPANVIRKFLNKFKEVWTEEYSAKATELGMTMDEIIRLASIIEKEGNSNDQFVEISSVLHNRLRRSGIYPTLDCDSTWDYIEHNIHTRVYTESERDKYEDNYWTYECIGLPAGAICNPGKAAIEAALNPESNNNYYFRHDKNGKIYLAETLEQHSANGAKVEKVNAES